MTPPAPDFFIRFDPRDVGADVPSPCISVCEIDPITALCQGCQRNIDEIIEWASAADEEKRHIWQRINRRRLAASND